MMVNLKIRQRLYKLGLLYRIAKTMVYNSGIVYFALQEHKQHNRKKLKALKAKNAGNRCFIIGNGPSLSEDDLELIKNEDSFGTNEIHRIFKKTSWRPKYYLITDRYSKTKPEELSALDVEYVFLGDYYCRHNVVSRKDYIMFHMHQGISESVFRVSKDISKRITNAPTVSFVAMQFAAFMGYDEIYLLGFDHNYSNSYANGVLHKKENIRSHFFDDERPEDIVANLTAMNAAYRCFNEYAQEHGIRVTNVSRKTNLDVFQKKSIEEVLRS